MQPCQQSTLEHFHHFIRKAHAGQGMVAHTCNSSYLRGGDGKNQDSRLGRGKKLAGPHLKKKKARYGGIHL
jgi:hypothetical protein